MPPPSVPQLCYGSPVCCGPSCTRVAGHRSQRQNDGFRIEHGGFFRRRSDELCGSRFRNAPWLYCDMCGSHRHHRRCHRLAAHLQRGQSGGVANRVAQRPQYSARSLPPKTQRTELSRAHLRCGSAGRGRLDTSASRRPFVYRCALARGQNGMVQGSVLGKGIRHDRIHSDCASEGAPRPHQRHALPELRQYHRAQTHERSGCARRERKLP